MRLVRHLCLLLLVTLASLALAQQQPTPPPGVEPPGTNPAATGPQAPVKETNKEKEKKKDRKISEKDAKQLFAQIDEILKFVSKDTGLPIKHPVKRELASR